MTVNLDNLETKYNTLFEKLGDRKNQVMKFRSFLESETSWLSSPASTRFHLNIERGLLLHSVGVTYNALRIKDLLAPDITDESVVITALFHDLGKVGLPGKPYYLPNKNKWEIEKRGIKVYPSIRVSEACFSPRPLSARTSDHPPKLLIKPPPTNSGLRP